MKFYNIRVVEADDLFEATVKVQLGDFEEQYDICDKIHTLEELKQALSYE